MKITKDISNEKETTFLSVALTTFTTIFVAEIGDKTQVATLLLSAESGKPLYIFIGAATALILSSLIGVLIGKWLASKVSPNIFNMCAGIIMLMISIFLYGQILIDTSIFNFLIF